MKSENGEPAMSTSISSRAAGLAIAAMLACATAMWSGGAATADPNPDAQFLALLDQKDISAATNAPGLIALGHRICGQLDAGTPADSVVEQMRDRSFRAYPADRSLPQDRFTRTIDKFITASVDAYCPNDQAKIAAIAS
jgi:hypothetical protein